MKTEKPEPLLHTPADQLSEVEHFKLNSNMVRGHLNADFKDHATADLVEESEALAKSHGIYLEYNRAKTGKEKDWMYMVRITIPGGGAFTRETWRVFDEISDKYTANAQGVPSLRVTTRQNIQYHWVKKNNVLPLLQTIARTGFFSLNGCGDNVRNVMGCPLSRFSKLYDAHAVAQKYGKFFQLPPDAHVQVFEIDTALIRSADGEERFEYAPNLLNRKFKIAFSAVHLNEETGQYQYDNCVELRTNEIGTAPIVNKRTGKVDAFQVYIGGSQGEKNGKTTFAAMGLPLGVFTEANLHKGLDAIVKVHQEWGDRKNRHWSRLKYVVHEKGIPWYQEQIKARGATFEQPIPDFDPGPRLMHHGWQKQQTNGLLAFGAYIENGRIINNAPSASTSGGGNGDLKKMVRSLLETFDGVEMLATPNQDLLFTNIKPEARADFEAHMKKFGYGERNGKAYTKLRLLSGACVGLDTCRLAYTESEQFEPELLDQLDSRGYGDMNESIGITGCERQCFRPATKTLGWVGQGPDMYALKIGASESGSHQGQYLVNDHRWFLRQVPRKHVADVCAALFDLYKAKRNGNEDMGATMRRLGVKAVLAWLSINPVVAPLLVKSADAPYLPNAVMNA